MKEQLSQAALKLLFTEARTYHAWTQESLPEEKLHQIYDLMKWGPTSMNTLPMRILFVKSEAEKQRLAPAMMTSNSQQVLHAPVTAIIAYDEKFFTHLPELFPAYNAKPLFENNQKLSEETAMRNGSLQGGYFIIAARALGLDVLPMSGFDANAINESFFKGTTWKVNFVCSLGVGDSAKLYPRGPRLSFEEACKII
ncbi:MAG: nitroreductase family protein [Pseudobdellovibrio sp.]|jgi:3-hydroxypropanoate dehydrogenase|nr:nitroreductase family protein [Pseudobdellovibrio sp.]